MPKRKKNDRNAQASRDHRRKQEDWLRDVLRRNAPELNVRSLAYLAEGISTTAYGAEVNGRAVVIKVTYEDDTMIVADEAWKHREEYGAPEGIAEVTHVIPVDEGPDGSQAFVFIQERAMLIPDLDRPGHMKVGDYAAPVVAEALETAVTFIMQQQLDWMEDIDHQTAYRVQEAQDRVTWEDLDDLARGFYRQLRVGEDFISWAMGYDPSLDRLVFDWAPRNVGIVIRAGEPAAVIIDLGLVM